jgi:hypothetical protein
MKRLTLAITDEQRAKLRFVFRGTGKGAPYLDRLVHLHRAEESAAALRGSPDELDSAEMALVLQAADQMLARNRRTDYAGILEEMDEIRRTDPPPGIPKKKNWLFSLLSFNGSSD